MIITLKNKTAVTQIGRVNAHYEGVYTLVDDFYSAVRVLKNQAAEELINILIHADTVPYELDRMVALATSVGITLRIVIDNPQSDITIEPLAALSISQYSNLSNKETIYNYIKSELASLKAEQKFLEDARERAIEAADRYNQKFEITDEVKAFVETWAPAYGLPIPRWEEQDATVTSHNPKHHTTLYKDWQDENLTDSQIKQRIDSWELKEKQRRRPTPYKDIVRITKSLQFFVRNNIPMDDNYILCPMCGKPFRTNRLGITQMQEDVLCSRCSPVANGIVVIEDAKLLSNYKVLLDTVGKVVDVLGTLEVVSFQDYMQARDND